MKTTFKLAIAIALVIVPLMPTKLVATSAVNGHLKSAIKSYEDARTTNWTGYEVLSSNNNNNYYTQVEGSWDVNPPDVVRSITETLAIIPTWVGLGGATSPVLWQAGTEARTWHWQDGSFAYKDYTFWYEDFGCSAPSPCPNNGWPVYVDYPTVSYGDRVHVKVHINGTVDFYNLTTGKSASYIIPIDNNNVGSSAEWVTELTCSDFNDASCVPTNFDDPSFSDAYAYGTNLSTYFDIMNYTRIDLVTSSNYRLTEPPKPYNHGFHVTCCS